MCVCSLPQNDQNSKTQSPRDLKNESLRIIWKKYLGSYGSLIARVYLIALKEPSDGSGHGNFFEKKRHSKQRLSQAYILGNQP